MKVQLKIPSHVFLPASFSKAVIVVIPDPTWHRMDYLPYVRFGAQVPCRSLDIGNIPCMVTRIKWIKIKDIQERIYKIDLYMYEGIPVGMEVESTGVYLSAFIVTLWSKIVPDPWN